MILLVAYVIFRPLFWVLVVVFGIIAALFAFAGALLLWEKLSKPRSAPWIEQKYTPREKAIGQRVDPCVAELASVIMKEADMTHDKRFALIDSDGIERYAQKLDGTFQVGKDRSATPADLATFARAILVDGQTGRFMRADRSKHGILGYGGRSREARGYILDPMIARQIGVAPQASL